MIEKLIPVLLGAILPVLFSAIGLIVSMWVRLAVLAEKQKYHTGQITMLLRRAGIQKINSGEQEETD